MIRLILAILLFAPAALAGPPDTSGIAYDQRQGSSLPLNTRFVEANGRPVVLRDLIRGPTILLLGYFHCPSLCGITRNDTLAGLAASGLVPGRDYTLLDVSIDPAETPAHAAAALAEDTQHKPAPADWHFLTGQLDAITALRESVGFHSRYDDALQQFLHPAGLVFVTPAGVVSGYLLGVGYTPSDLRAGILRARDGSYAAASPILLLCLHFDPATGRYSLEVMKLLRLAAIFTVLVLGAALILAHRRGGRPA